MSDSDLPPIVKAIFDGDVSATERCLSKGAAPDLLWGTLPLVTHAALLPNYPIFRLLVASGAKVPEEFLSDVINWELGDWRITTQEDEDQLVYILKDIRATSAWLPLAKRRELASTLDGYHLHKIVSILLE